MAKEPEPQLSLKGEPGTPPDVAKIMKILIGATKAEGALPAEAAAAAMNVAAQHQEAIEEKRL